MGGDCPHDEALAGAPSRPPDDAALVAAVALHVEVAVIGNGEDVGGHLPNLLVSILADMLWRVDGEQLVGVHSHQDGACVRLWAKRDEELATSHVGDSAPLHSPGRDSTGFGVTCTCLSTSWGWGLQTSLGSGLEEVLTEVC